MALKEYVVNLITTEQLPTFTKKVFQIYKKEKEFIKPDDIHYVYNSLAEKLPKHSKILIRGLGIDKMTDLAKATKTTLKGFKDDELKFFDEEDYYNASSKVKDVSKFLQYFQIEFIILIPKVIPKTGQLNLNFEKSYVLHPGWEYDEDRQRASNPLQNQKAK
jgi:hypothetical protein